VLHSVKISQADISINEARKKIATKQSEFSDRLKDTQQNIIDSPEIKNMTVQTISSVVYKRIANSATTLFLFPYIWLAARTANDTSANDLAYHLNHAIEKDKAFKECMIDQKRVLNDLGLQTRQMDSKNSDKRTLLSVYKIKANLNSSIQIILRSKTLVIYNFTGNLLPLFFTVQALTRAFLSWIHGVWLPSDFFIHASMLIAGSTLPGYMLFATGINRKISGEKIAELDLNGSNEILISTDNKLEELQKSVNTLKTQVTQQIKFNEKELENSGYGTTSKN
jgi:hypothetical protein